VAGRIGRPLGRAFVDHILAESDGKNTGWGVVVFDGIATGIVEAVDLEFD
jgi:hypothetical protein